MSTLKILFAFFYDFILILAVIFVAAIPFTMWQGAGFHQDAFKLVAFQTYLLAIIYIYLSYFWTNTGQTPGLRVWHLKITRNDNYAMTRYDANLRFLFGILFFIIGWIGLFYGNKQTLQDRLAHTKITPIDEK